MTIKHGSELPKISISNRGSAEVGANVEHVAPLRGKPMGWLGAKSPFGLALPDAQPTAATMYAPRGVWIDDQRLVVCDSGNHRILIWNSVSIEDHGAADVVLGQPDFESEGPAARGRGPENGLHLPTGVIVADGRLVVADAWHHRVLVWDRVPDNSDTTPDYAVGQSDLFSVKSNRGAAVSRSGLNWPYGVGWFDGQFWVADTGNRRLLMWEGFPEHDRPADVVVGQNSESDAEENRGGDVAANSFRWPHDFASHNGQLFVADAGNHRVLCWNEFPKQDRSADALIGQNDFSTAYELPYDAQGNRRLRFPYAIAVCDGVLAVADTANNRVLFWRLPFSGQCNSPAVDVIGQLDFAANGENHWLAVSNQTLCWPYGICFHDGKLAIADSGNNRVVLWDCREIIDHS